MSALWRLATAARYTYDHCRSYVPYAGRRLTIGPTPFTIELTSFAGNPPRRPPLRFTRSRRPTSLRSHIALAYLRRAGEHAAAQYACWRLTIGPTPFSITLTSLASNPPRRPPLRFTRSRLPANFRSHIAFASRASCSWFISAPFPFWLVVYLCCVHIIADPREEIVSHTVNRP